MVIFEEEANTLKRERKKKGGEIEGMWGKFPNKKKQRRKRALEDNEKNIIFRGRKVSVDECQEVRNPALGPSLESCVTVDETLHLSFHICKMGSASPAQPTGEKACED